MNETIEYLKLAIEHAPRDPGRLNGSLRGWKDGDGVYVCNRCAGRIIARGCRWPTGFLPVWADTLDTDDVCCLCKENQ